MPSSKLSEFLFSLITMFAFSPKLHLIARPTLIVFALTLAAAPAYAQSITAAPDGTNTTILHNGNLYTIDGGTQAGANLFHSFGEFGLTPQETAHFLSNPSIRNVLGRVVGGNPSTIEGMIRLSGGNSNLFLMNPAGIVFTQGASLDLPGSFVATTATRIGFEDGFFNAYGANNYAALSSDPTGFIFDTETGSIFNDGILEVAEGQSLWLVGSSVLNTGTLRAPGGNVTIAAVPGGHQIRISQDNMMLNLVLDAVPLDEGVAIDPMGLRPADLPRYLTGGSELVGANTATIAADGTVYLTSTGGTSAPVQPGDALIAGPVEAATVQLMAAGQVTPTNYDLVQGETTVVRFPEQNSDPLALTAIDTTVQDYRSFLFGGTAGTISFTVSPEESGIAAIGDQLDLIGGAGEKVDAIHIVSEGSAGNLWLGSDFISHENIDQYEAQLQTWNVNLTTSADILLYSCLTALGEAGDTVINRLADATGADVAASTNITGHSAFGGDWVLEKSTGTIETGLGFEAGVISDYQGKLSIFTVTNGGDAGAGSLRQAISDANALAGADEIRFSGVTSVDLTSAQLAINTGDLTITGGTTNVTIQRDAGAGNFRIFNVVNVATTFDNLTIRNGQVAGNGGGISSNRAVDLTNSTISGNSSSVRGGGVYIGFGGTLALTNSTVSSNSSANGGGIYTRGALTLDNSTVSGNTVTSRGGGIRALNTVNLNNSTVSGNTSTGNGGGIYSNSITTLTNSTVSGNTSGGIGGGIRSLNQVNLTNSTVSGNMSTSNGGGIYTSSTANLTNSTVSGNSSNLTGGGIRARGGTIRNSTIAYNTAGTTGGGIFRVSGTFDIANSIVAQNTATVTGNDLSGTFTTIENSLIGDTVGATITNDINNLIGADPLLFALGDYGGSTQTHALRPDSPALNAGSNALAVDAIGMAALSTDQRGAGRIFGGTVDLGAYESHGFSLLPVTPTSAVDRNATAFSPIDASMQVVENAFSQPLPLAGLSVGYALSDAAVLGSFGSGTTVVTNAQGIAVNTLNLTGFGDSFSGAFQILATPVSVASFVQQVEGGLLPVDTFASVVASPVVSVGTVSNSLDFSAFVGLADLWERRDRAFTCSTIPLFVLAAEDEEQQQEDSSPGAEDCFPYSPFEAQNRLIDSEPG